MRPARRTVGSKTHTAPARRTLTTDTAQVLRDRILSGELAEGEPLRQEALAAELDVSRIPVREALRLLEAEGLIVFNPHRGAVVSSAPTEEVEELFELRALIESDLFRRAIPRVDSDTIERAYAILTTYDEALLAGRVSDYGSLNWELHSTLYAPAQRPFVLGVVEKLHRQADRYMRMQLALTHGEERAQAEHVALVEAAKSGNAARGAALLRQHIVAAGRSLTEFLRNRRK